MIRRDAFSISGYNREAVDFAMSLALAREAVDFAMSLALPREAVDVAMSLALARVEEAGQSYGILVQTEQIK